MISATMLSFVSSLLVTLASPFKATAKSNKASLRIFGN